MLLLSLELSTSKAQITRTQIISNAVPYTLFSWTAYPGNVLSGGYYCSSVGRYIYAATCWVKTGSNNAMPYCWGGWSTISQFTSAMDVSSNTQAGDVCSVNCGGGCSGLSSAPLSCAGGHDCSGLVSRAWELSTKYGTSTLPSISYTVPLASTQPGDILNLAGSHTRLVETNYGNGNYRVIEASGLDWKCAYHSYTPIQLASYNPRCYNKVHQGPTPMNDSSEKAVQFPSLVKGKCIEISYGENIEGATQSLPPNLCTGCNCTSPSAMDVWFRFTAVDSIHSITISGLSGFDAVIEIRLTGTNNGTFVECYDPVGSPASLSYTFRKFTPGQDYFIRIFDWGSIQPDQTGFDLCINTPGFCSDFFEDNNSCDSAFLILPEPFKSDSVNYSLDANIGFAGDEDWYKIVTNHCGVLTLNLTAMPYNYDLELYRANCSGQLISQSKHANTTNEQIIYHFTSSLGDTFLLKVFAANTTDHTADSCYQLHLLWRPALMPVCSSISGNDSICQGSMEVFSVTATNATSFWWSVPADWVINHGQGTQTLVVIAGALGGNLAVRPSNSCLDGTVQAIQVDVKTVDTSIVRQGLKLKSNAVQAVYQWVACPLMIPIPGEIQQIFTPIQTGSYAVLVTRDDCTDTSACYHVDELGLRTIDRNGMLSVFPNPVGDVLNIEITGLPAGCYQLELINTLGKLIFEEKMMIHEEITSKQLYISNISPGIYFLSVYSGTSRLVMKILK
jgi:hypothetical protein